MTLKEHSHPFRLRGLGCGSDWHRTSIFGFSVRRIDQLCYATIIECLTAGLFHTCNARDRRVTTPRFTLLSTLWAAIPSTVSIVIMGNTS